MFNVHEIFAKTYKISQVMSQKHESNGIRKYYILRTNHEQIEKITPIPYYYMPLKTSQLRVVLLKLRVP